MIRSRKFAKHPTRWLGAIAAVLAMAVGGASARAESVKEDLEKKAIEKQDMKICANQTYALCASARCTVYDGVAYCQCEVKKGNSISLPFPMHKGDVCEVNAKGPINRYMVSTYSLPEEVIAPNGKRAIYHCGGGPSEGAYAQCDGGMCFASTEGKSFPGFDKPIPKGQIICACPITTASGAAVVVGHEIMGPYPCDKSYLKYCVSDVANTKTGSTIYVGAPPGMVRNLAMTLNGKVPELNECRP
ncbi:MAG: hypothetical protein JST54_13125 [Deltaproteobacteria bacterium]|nr:hypothetical protein [Deltaproteobacteria bacterium]